MGQGAAAKIEPAINLSRPEAIFSLPSKLTRACGLTSYSLEVTD
jgi:hypothetical protein